MVEPEFCASNIQSPFREESGDEELSVLPRHTKVIVTGNNRTKSVLLGLQGVVKKAVGLGGWHWLVFLIFIVFSLCRVLFTLCTMNFSVSICLLTCCESYFKSHNNGSTMTLAMLFSFFFSL